jgi:pyridinium-3,5-biscarboxylic acid mononucleotide synthase
MVQKGTFVTARVLNDEAYDSGASASMLRNPPPSGGTSLTTEKAILEVLESVAQGRVSKNQALEKLRNLPFEDLGFAKIDQHRNLRRGVPEVVYGEGKTASQIAAIGRRIIGSGNTLIVTRLAPDKARAVKRVLRPLRYYPQARLGAIKVETTEKRCHGVVSVVSAGTSDMTVAEEAALCAELLGNRVARVYDVGVAGIHRLTAHREILQNASVLIVVAGMEGALASVVGGLVDKPVIAVPTSVGYGTAFGGITALLGMLNTCSSGVTVVNIDNGFGAAISATLINRIGVRL